MSLDNLSDVFQRAISEHTSLDITETKELLMKKLRAKKFDTQDMAIIEAILNDKEKTFEESFMQSIQNLKADIGNEQDLDEFLRCEESRHTVTDIFLRELDNQIDFFYNVLITRHLSG